MTIATVAIVLLLIGAYVVATKTEVIAELNATRAGYLARVIVKERRAWAEVTSSTPEVLIASDLVDAVTSSALNDRGRAVRESQNGASNGGARRGVISLGTVAPT